jgi:tetratricopeptide (TPR) repeat protein
LENNARLAYNDYIEALKSFEYVGEDKMMAMIYNEIGELFFEKQLYDQANFNFNEALAHSEESSEQNIANFHYGIAKTIAELGEYAESLDHFLIAIEINERLKKIDYVISSYLAMGVMQSKAGNKDLARGHYAKVIEIAKFSKKPNENLRNANNNIANTYIKSGNFVEAEKYLLKALAYVDNNHEENFGQPYVTYNNLGIVYFEKKNYEKAWHYFKKSINANNKRLDVNELGITNEVIQKFYQKNAQPDSLYYYTQLINNLAMPRVKTSAWMQDDNEKIALVTKYQNYLQDKLQKKQQAKISWLMGGTLLFIMFSGLLGARLWKIYHYQPINNELSLLKNSDELVYLLDSFKNEKDELKRTMKQKM